MDPVSIEMEKNKKNKKKKQALYQVKLKIKK
jgi:hypothetical protein